jgi:hypothetical protein
VTKSSNQSNIKSNMRREALPSQDPQSLTIVMDLHDHLYQHLQTATFRRLSKEFSKSELAYLASHILSLYSQEI